MTAVAPYWSGASDGRRGRALTDLPMLLSDALLVAEAYLAALVLRFVRA